MRKVTAILCGLLCLISLCGCGQRKTSGSTDLLSAAEKNENPYIEVLNTVAQKLKMADGTGTDDRCLLYDINGDNVEELLLRYEYPRDYATMEIWTQVDGQVIQLAAVSDLGCLAGAGIYGVSLSTWDEEPVACFWMNNQEASPPGTTCWYDLSLWTIRNGILTNPNRIGWTVFRDASSTRLESTYGWMLSGATVEEVLTAEKALIEEPEFLFDGSQGETVEDMLKQMA